MALAGARHRIGGAGRLLVRELSAFGVVGTVCFALDLAVFQVLYGVTGLDPALAKLGSAAVSTTVAYVGHRYWSFAHRARSTVRREYAVFALVNAATLLLSLGIVTFVHEGLGQDGSLVLQTANVGSIALGTVIRFLAYRRWVFRAPTVDPRTGPDGDRVAPATTAG
ncbi:GtrA family protein [Modestobacter sp. SYSU DS0290]